MRLGEGTEEKPSPHTHTKFACGYLLTAKKWQQVFGLAAVQPRSAFLYTQLRAPRVGRVDEDRLTTGNALKEIKHPPLACLIDRELALAYPSCDLPRGIL